jgi:hypothetical protein
MEFPVGVVRVASCRFGDEEATALSSGAASPRGFYENSKAASRLRRATDEFDAAGTAPGLASNGSLGSIDGQNDESGDLDGCSYAQQPGLDRRVFPISSFQLPISVASLNNPVTASMPLSGAASSLPRIEDLAAWFLVAGRDGAAVSYPACLCETAHRGVVRKLSRPSLMGASKCS